MTGNRGSTNSNTGFQIDWDVEEPEWQEAHRVVKRKPSGGEFDRRGEAFFLLLSGPLQFRYRGSALFPQDRLRADAELRRRNHMEMGDSWFPIPADHESKGIQTQLLDFADQLIAIIGTLATNSTIRSRLTTFWPNEGGVRILFSRFGEVVTIESELFLDPILRIPFDEFMPETHRFLRDFIMALDHNVQGILDWVSFGRLRTYAQAHGLMTGD